MFLVGVIISEVVGGREGVGGFIFFEGSVVLLVFCLLGFREYMLFLFLSLFIRVNVIYFYKLFFEGLSCCWD